MTPDIVADIGNSRIKWGLCRADQVAATASLPADEPATWQSQLNAWSVNRPVAWAVSGVHPQRCESLMRWIEQRGDQVLLVSRAAQLPLRVDLEHPDRVGIDRLLDAVACTRGPRRSVPAVIVDAGSAITVDWVDAGGVFCGGAIFPGLRLMAQSLRDHTALLPLVTIQHVQPPFPGRDTRQAIEAGVAAAAAGGINALIHRLAEYSASRPTVFLTGGDAVLLSGAIVGPVQVWPEMTLEGLRLSVSELDVSNS